MVPAHFSSRGTGEALDKDFQKHSPERRAIYGCRGEKAGELVAPQLAFSSALLSSGYKAPKPHSHPIARVSFSGDPSPNACACRVWSLAFPLHQIRTWSMHDLKVGPVS